MLLVADFEILRAGYRSHAWTLECPRVTRENELHVIELGAGANEPILEIRLTFMERKLAFLRTHWRNNKQFRQQADRLASLRLPSASSEHVILCSQVLVDKKCIRISTQHAFSSQPCLFL